MQPFANLMLGLLVGMILAAIIAYLAYRVRALSRSGAWAALVTGTLIFGLGGLPWATLLLIFFLSSSALSRAFARRKSGLGEKFAKGSRRDAGQVLANGGLGALLALGLVLLPALELPTAAAGLGQAAALYAAFAGAMAAVNADTWATELGVLSTRLPRLITNGRRVERGTSGGVTLLGYLAALGGAALVGLAAALFMPAQSALTLLALLILWIAAGLAGSTFDSLLGATIQAIYYCPQCQKETERHPLHACGTPTSLRRGWTWLNNDVVNFFCSLVGAGVALLGWVLLF